MTATPAGRAVRRAGMPWSWCTLAAGVAGLACLGGVLTPAAYADEKSGSPEGAAAFQSNCALCHGPAGAGVPALAPAITDYPARYAATSEGRRQLAMTVLYGMFGEITVGDAHFNGQMPDLSRLDDATLAAILNFVVFDLAHAPADVKPLTAAEIAAERAHTVDGAAVRAHRKSLAIAGP
ncbi:MAG TPA: cytochrome c [Steroidobacteraceae bacterium]|nr:cytochrome c [Steroidobacteraceae bacterium]